MISRFLVSLTGADYRLLVEVREVRKYAGMGGAVLLTAVLAAVSAAFALRTAVDAPLWVTAVLAGAWGLGILNLDSWIVASNKRLSTKWKTVVAAAPRFLLAVVLGIVISEPLVLQVFKAEIDAELTVVRSEKEEAFEARLETHPRYERLERDQREARQLQDEIAAGVPASAITDDPDVKQAQAAYDRLDAQLQQAQARTSCEGQGTCGTGQAGAGTVFETNLATQRRLERAVEQAQASLDRTRAEARGEAVERTRTQAQAAQARLAELERSIDAAARQRQDEIEEHRVKLEASDGVLGRMGALGRIADEEPELEIARWLLFAFLLTIECTPALIKLMNNLTPPSDYERYFDLEQRQLLEHRDLESKAALDEVVVRLWDQRRQVQSEVDAADLERSAPLEARRQAYEAERRQDAIGQHAAVEAAQLQAVIDVESVRIAAEAAAQEQREPALAASYRHWTRMEQQRNAARRSVEAETILTESARVTAEAAAAARRQAEEAAEQAKLSVLQRKVQAWVRAQEPLIGDEVQRLIEEGRQEAAARAAAVGQRRAEAEARTAQAAADAAALERQRASDLRAAEAEDRQRRLEAAEGELKRLEAEQALAVAREDAAVAAARRAELRRRRRASLMRRSRRIARP